MTTFERWTPPPEKADGYENCALSAVSIDWLSQHGPMERSDRDTPSGFTSSEELLSQISTSTEIADIRSIPGQIRDGIRDGIRDVYNDTVTRVLPVDSADAGSALDRRSLRGSFTSHALSKLEQDGVIRVGIVDDFSSAHGRGVEDRLRASLPGYIRDHVEIVRYDVSQGSDAAFQAAARDARNKDITVLSVSGGLEAVSLSGLEQSLGEPVNQANRGRAFETSLERFQSRSDYQSLRANMTAISEASRVIPVVTPIWNDGNTTPAALASNTLVTSLSGSTRATRSSLPDIYIQPLPGNDFTSQSPPRVIGAMFGLLLESQVRDALGTRR